MRNYNWRNTTAALPTGESLNPANPEGATYYDKGQVCFVLQRVDEPRNRPDSCDNRLRRRGRRASRLR